jgi:hypothetical protein
MIVFVDFLNKCTRRTKESHQWSLEKSSHEEMKVRAGAWQLKATRLQGARKIPMRHADGNAA